MFLKNYWYAVAWDHEIKQKPFARTICNEKIVFYRRIDGSLAALEDCCPHRMLPLSKGFVENGNLVCGYHGIELNGKGECVHMPNQKNINKKAKVTSYPVVERHRYVWVWIGDPELASEDQIPDLHWCSDPDWTFDGDTYHIKCDYRLLIDNLMDLTHEAFVHPSSIGQHELMDAPITTESNGESARVSRWMRGIMPPPFWSANLKSEEKCDRWQICDFTLPSNVMIDVGVAIAGSGAPEGDRSKGVTGIVTGLMTPETETSTWYHWGFARNFDIADRGMTVRIREAQRSVFAEDEVVLEAQQENILQRPDRELINFNIDAGGVHARKIIERGITQQLNLSS